MQSNIQLLAQPYSAMELAAFISAVMAVLFAALWRRDREPGMGWFALSLALLATWMGANRWHLPMGNTLPPTLWSAVPMVAGMVLAVGVSIFLPLPARWRRISVVLGIALPLPYIAMVVYTVVTGAPVLRSVANVVQMLIWVQLATLAFWSARREPGAGYAWLGASMSSIVVLSVGAVLMGAHGLVLRYWSILPILAMLPTLLTVTLLRRRLALENEVARRAQAELSLTELNASLEAKVTQRTADLNEIVSGLESFNRSISHDLRGPLGGIAGAAQLAEEALMQGDSESAKRMVRAIAAQATRSTELVEALLRLARVRDAVIKPRPVDVNALAHDVIEKIRQNTRTNAFPLIDVTIAEHAQADPDLLRVILTNLIGNSVKFTRNRENAHIEVGARHTENSTEVFVCDNGVGFDPQKAALMFQPFSRLHGAEFEGHGVGLSIVQRAVERHGGRVWAEVEPQGGACFHFTLPELASDGALQSQGNAQ